MKRNKRKQRKLFLLLVVILITTIVLLVETYAWFVGISTVNVSEFNIAVSSEDGLEISLDGEHWKGKGQTLTISKNSITKTNISGDHTYVGNTNKWSDYLIPLSSIGEMVASTGRLKFYDEGSLSTSPGGYKLVANQVDNTTAEADGYIAFDLFIKNGTGSSYINEVSEDVFLTANSHASASLSGSVDYGVANSLRIGFFSVGNIATKGSAIADITGLSCGAICDVGPDDLTGINFLNSSYYGHYGGVWEPNYTSHTTNVINYYNQICNRRHTETSDYEFSYFNPDISAVAKQPIDCPPLTSNTFKKTYSIFKNLTTSDDTDIYDKLNGHPNANLYSINTYKDSDLLDSGSDKRPIFQLAGNSITKMRVYIWIEGQDIDNYDVITREPNININFGFTKDRYSIESSNTSSATSSFATDSWATIKYNVQHNNTNQYHVGDSRQLMIGNKIYELRLANKSSPSGICTGSTNSQTACGFVVEFVESYTLSRKNNSGNGISYVDSLSRTSINNTIYPSLPADLKNVIIDTRVVSTYEDSVVTCTDKLYLLSAKEVLNTNFWDSTGASMTRQLDYYANNGVALMNNNRDYVVNRKFLDKKCNDMSCTYWLRNGNQDIFYNGSYYAHAYNAEFALFPAFRIG